MNDKETELVECFNSFNEKHQRSLEGSYQLFVSLLFQAMEYTTLTLPVSSSNDQSKLCDGVVQHLRSSANFQPNFRIEPQLPQKQTKVGETKFSENSKLRKRKRPSF